MKQLNKEELLRYHGGGISVGVGLLIATGICFLIGAIDGFLRPLKCR